MESFSCYSVAESLNQNATSCQVIIFSFSVHCYDLVYI